MYSTRNEAHAATIRAIEAGGGVQDAETEYDVDAIVDEAYEYSAELGGFAQLVDTDGFWELVAKHAKADA
ncbi:hypothetical protein [Zhihengliuella sp.]|uniref:hypothetical protein n=1 Tax=Zhihengliuella sp. TaxID=1954483 RepID=UPI0028121164|nr:hypothetical protein [Zhihengliuella sp.]